MQSLLEKIQNKNFKIYLILFLSIFVFVLIYETYILSKKSFMTVNFLDVGQGDSILITTPNGGKILIDGGRDGVVLEKLGQEFSFLEKNIKIVLGTHADLDHIAGLNFVLQKYNVGNLFLSLPFSENEVNKNLIDIANEKEVNIVHVKNPQTIKTDDGVKIEILFPVQDMSGILEPNDASVVTKISYGKISFLLTGDLSQAGELYLVDTYGEKLKSDILKLGHHGSDTSSNIKFLEKVKPVAVVVSAGKNNSFGHPHASVIEMVNKFGAQIFSTLGEGNVKLQTDGVSVWRD